MKISQEWGLNLIYVKYTSPSKPNEVYTDNNPDAYNLTRKYADKNPDAYNLTRKSLTHYKQRIQVHEMPSGEQHCEYSKQGKAFQIEAVLTHKKVDVGNFL